MAIKRFSSADWLTSHGYELPQSPSSTGAYSYSASKPIANKTLDIDRFSSADWLRDNGYDIPKPYEYKAPTIDYNLERQNIEQEKKNLATGMGFSMPDITDGLSVGEGLGATGQYLGGKATSGIGSVIGAIFEMPDMTTKAFNNMMGAVVNPIRKAMGLEALDYNISLREWEFKVGKEIQKTLGIKDTQIDTTKLKNEGLAQFIDDYQNGKNQMAELYYRTAQNFSEAVEPIKQEVDKVKTGWSKFVSGTMKYGGAVVESAPQSALYAIPVVGAVIGTGATYSRALRESYAREDLTGLQATNLGMTSGAIDAYSELIFGLFGEGAALVKGATAKTIAKTAGGAVGKATVGKVIGSVFLSGVEEGLEEMIAYPAQQYLQWRYSNGGKPVEEYADFFNWKDFGDAGAIGFLSGFMFAGGQAVRSSILDAKQRKKVEKIEKQGIEISQMPTEDIANPENKVKINDFINTVSDAVINDPEIFDEQSPLKPPVAEPVVEPIVEPETMQEPVMQEQPIVEQEPTIDMSQKEVLSTKTSTGEVFKIGENVYKNTTYKDGKTKTFESKAYELLSGEDEIAQGNVVEIDGKEYIETPYFEHVISIDDIPKDRRELYNQIIIDNIERIKSAINKLTDNKIIYNDPLQFGYRDGKLYLMDFSNSHLEGEFDSRDNAYDENSDTLSNFLEQFGVPRLSQIISKSKYYRGWLELYDSEDVKNGDVLLSKKEIPILEKLKSSGGNLSPNNAYYATNARDIWIDGIAQTDSIDGVKYIYSETPISEKLQKEWEITKIYEGTVPSKKSGKIKIKLKAKQETKTAPKPKTEKPKPTITFKSIMASTRNDAEYKQAIDEWLDTDEGKIWTGKMDTPEKVANQIVALKQSLVNIRTLPVAQQEKAMLKVNLQLLALKSFADRSMNVPEGKRLRSVLGNLIPRLTMGRNQQDITTIENTVSNEDMFYMVLGDEKAMNDGLALASRSDADEIIRQKFIDGDKIEREDVVAIFKRIQKKLENVENENDIIEAQSWWQTLSEKATESGQFIEAFKVAYKLFPEYQAKSVEKKLKNIVGHDKLVDYDMEKRSKEVVGAVNAVKKEAFNRTAEDAETTFEKASADVKPVTDKPKGSTATKTPVENKQPQDELSPSEQLAKKIEQSQKERKIDTNEVKRMVNELYRKYLEVAQLPEAPKKIDPFAFLAEVAINRKQYAYVYDDAKNIIKNTFEDSDAMIDFFNQVTNPVFAQSTMNRAIGIILKEHNVSLAQASKEVVLTDWTGVDKYEAWLKEKFTFLDDASRNYLMEYLMEKFNVMVASKRSAMYDAYEKRVGKGKERKDMRDVTIEALKDVTFYNALKIDSINALWARRLGLPYIDDSMRNTIHKYMKLISKQQMLDTVDADRKIESLYEEMYRELFKNIPASLQDKIKAIRRFGMLGNFRTPIRNGTTNYVNGLLMNLNDRLMKHMEVSKTFGVSREYQVFGGKFYERGSSTAIDNTVKESMTEEHMRVLLDQSSTYSLASIRGVAQQIFKNKFVDSMIKVPYKLQQTGELGKLNMKFLSDSFMFERHFRFAMENKLNMLGYNEHMTIEQKKSAIETAEKYANQVAIVRTFRERNNLSNFIKTVANAPWIKREVEILYEQADKLKVEGKTQEYEDTLNKIKVLKKTATAINTTVDFVAPFVVTPASLIKESYKYSPLSLAMGLGKFVYAKKTNTFKGERAVQIDQQIAQSVVGTVGLTILGAVLRGLGILELDEPENEKEKQLWQQEGRSPYSIYIKGLGSFTIDWMQPLVSSLLFGGYFHDFLFDKESWGEKFIELGLKSGDAILNKSLADNILRQFGGYGSRSLTTTMTSIASNGLLQSLPLALQQFNRVLDPYTRNAYDGNALQIVANRILMTIPGGTYAIDAKYDIWGRPIQQTKFQGIVGGMNRFAMNMVYPFTLSEEKMDSTTKEIVRLYKALEADPKSATGVLPIGTGNSITVTVGGLKRNWTLNVEQAQEYQQLSGQYQKEIVDKVISNPLYANKSDTVKAKAIADVYEKGKKKAQQEIMKKYPPTSVVRP